ncbi:hypothetical protein JOM56_007468 [Amanita muscaria]
MSAQELAVVFFLTAYLAPLAFIIHILWLLASAVLSGKPMVLVLQDVEVIEENFLLPHSPGFFDPLQVDLERSPENSGFDGVSGIVSPDDLGQHDFDSTYALENESSGYEIQDVTADTLDLDSDKSQLQDSSEPWHTKGHLDSADRLTLVASVDDTRSFVRRSTQKKIKHFFRKSSSSETQRNSTAFSRRVTQVFNKISTPWSKRKERQKRQDMASI